VLFGTSAAGRRQLRAVDGAEECPSATRPGYGYPVGISPDFDGAARRYRGIAMDWADFVNILCDTEADAAPRVWLSPRDTAEDANIAIYRALRHRSSDPFRFLKKDR
jgi:hypothetical protein